MHIHPPAAPPLPRLAPLPPETLDAALATLAQLPLDAVPDRAPALPEGSRLPLDPNPLFVGRHAELRALAEAFKTNAAHGPCPTVALTGLGGQGKTQLAVEFAHRYGPSFAGAIFWLSFANADAVAAEVAACGLSMPEMPPHYADLDLPTQTALVEAAWARPLPRLLLFDNCEDASLLERWRPKSGRCYVLLTSRNQVWAASLGVAVLPVGDLPRPESVQLLRRFRPDLAPDNPTLDDIADTLGDLPLALHLAGSYLAAYQHDVTPEHFLAQLASPDLLTHPALQSGDHSPTHHELHVARTFALSYQRLAEPGAANALAARLLACAAAFLPGEPIPRDLLRAAVQARDEPQGIGGGDALRRLLALGLLTPAAQGAVTLHRLVAHFIRTADPAAATAAQAAVEVAVAAKANRLNDLAIPGPLLAWQPHLRHIADTAIQRASPHAAYLANALGYHLNLAADLAGARHYYEQALDIWREVLGERHPDTALSLNNLGDVLRAQGDLAGAKQHYEQALDIWREVLGERHPHTATSLNNLGYVLQDLGDLAGAKQHYEQALAIFEERLGPNHPHTNLVRENLAQVTEELGQPNDRPKPID